MENSAAKDDVGMLTPVSPLSSESRLLFDPPHGLRLVKITDLDELTEEHFT
jgi:hypothetical protein